MKRVKARQAIKLKPLTPALVYKVMRSLFPKKNDFGNASYEEVNEELVSHGVATLGQFIALIKKHRRALLDWDQTPLSPLERRAYLAICSPDEIADSIRRRYWYAYVGLVRNAIELEFGEGAVVSEGEA